MMREHKMMKIYRVSAAVLLLATIAAVPSAADGSRQTATPIIPEGWQGIYDSMGFSPALRLGDTIYVSGIIVKLVGEGSYEERYANGLRETFKVLETMLKPMGATLDDVIEMTSFHTDLQRQLHTILTVRKEIMALPHSAWTAVGTTALALPDGQTEIKFLVKLKAK